MPATFTVDAANLKQVLAELRKVDPELKKELQKEMRSELKPFAQKLGQAIPKQPPMSGMAPGVSSSAKWAWRGVGNRIVTPLGKRAKKPGFYPVVSMRFRSRSKSAAFEIAETTRGARSPQGEAWLRTLNAFAPVKGGLGRFVIPEARDNSGDVTKVAVRVIEKFTEKVNRRLR